MQIKQLPNELVFRFVSFLEPKELFLFAQTAPLYRDIAHLGFLSKNLIKHDDNKGYRLLLEYWIENPKMLLEKPQKSRNEIKKLLEQRISDILYLDILNLTYSCLVILNLAEKNYDSMKEYLYRLYMSNQCNVFTIMLLFNTINKQANSQEYNENNTLLHFNEHQRKYLLVAKDLSISNALNYSIALFDNIVKDTNEAAPFTLKGSIHLSSINSKLTILIPGIYENIEKSFLTVLRLCIKKLSSKEVIKFLVHIFNEVYSLIGKTSFKIFAKALDLCLFRLNAEESFNIFEKLIDFLPARKTEFPGKHEYTNLLVKLIDKADDFSLKRYLNKLNHALSKQLTEQELKKLNVLLENYPPKNKDNKTLEFRDFLSLFLKLKIDYSSIFTSICKKFIKFCYSSNAVQIDQYIKILHECSKNTKIYSLIDIQTILLMLLPNIDLVSYYEFLPLSDDTFNPTANLICETMFEFGEFINRPILNMNEENAKKYFRDYFDEFLQQPYYYGIMSIIANSLSFDEADRYLNLILNGEITSAYGVTEVISNLAKRAYSTAEKSLTATLFDQFIKINDNNSNKIKRAYALKVLFANLSFDEIKDYIPSLLKEFAKNPSVVIILINEVVHYFNDKEINECVQILFNDINKPCGSITQYYPFCRVLLDKFSNDQINELYRVHIEIVIQKSKSGGGMPNFSESLMYILIPKLNAKQLFTLYTVNSQWASSVCERIKHYNSKIINDLSSNNNFPQFNFIKKLFDSISLPEPNLKRDISEQEENEEDEGNNDGPPNKKRKCR